MTREQAIAYGKRVIDLGLNDETQAFCELAIKALEQEPFEDCVSRAEVVDELNRLGRNAFKYDTDYDNFFAFLDSLPSVTPIRKVGKWEHGQGGYMRCSLCHKAGSFNYNFCPNCGAEMEE